MIFFTESELREMWKDGRGKLPAFPPGSRFSASALDFIGSERIEIRYLSSESGLASTLKSAISTSPDWDKPATFPVNLNGPVPICSECGQPLHSKPDHMTQLDTSHYAPKSSPRLAFRGRVDGLHALFMLVASTARRFELPEMAQQLDSLAAYCREIMSAEYNWRPVASLVLLGKNEEELHELSHWPDRYLGIQHLVPGSMDHEIIHWLNLLRTQTREVEIIALQNLGTQDAGAGLSRALNRLSSAVYVLELYFQAGKLNWKVTG